MLHVFTHSKDKQSWVSCRQCGCKKPYFWRNEFAQSKHACVKKPEFMKNYEQNLKYQMWDEKHCKSYFVSTDIPENIIETFYVKFSTMRTPTIPGRPAAPRKRSSSTQARFISPYKPSSHHKRSSTLSTPSRNQSRPPTERSSSSIVPNLMSLKVKSPKSLSPLVKDDKDRRKHYNQTKQDERRKKHTSTSDPDPTHHKLAHKHSSSPTKTPKKKQIETPTKTPKKKQVDTSRKCAKTLSETKPKSTPAKIPKPNMTPGTPSKPTQTMKNPTVTHLQVGRDLRRTPNRTKRALELLKQIKSPRQSNLVEILALEAELKQFNKGTVKDLIGEISSSGTSSSSSGSGSSDSSDS